MRLGIRSNRVRYLADGLTLNMHHPRNITLTYKYLCTALESDFYIHCKCHNSSGGGVGQQNWCQRHSGGSTGDWECAIIVVVVAATAAAAVFALS
ncbi:Hypothetical predicted protein [Octopus vulgaris]|uniref:Uncharacterized protein n=1 Tax=Octopus vulgaris TaxID=6645 RepID=A0AA36BKT7_OCTVU|nr:Hypothetical predicted protein [Octopus vulgaris]